MRDSRSQKRACPNRGWAETRGAAHWLHISFNCCFRPYPARKQGAATHTHTHTRINIHIRTHTRTHKDILDILSYIIRQRDEENQEHIQTYTTTRSMHTNEWHAVPTMNTACQMCASDTHSLLLCGVDEISIALFIGWSVSFASF